LLHTFSATVMCHSIFTHSGLSWEWNRISTLIPVYSLWDLSWKNCTGTDITLNTLVFDCHYIPPVSILVFHLCIPEASLNKIRNLTAREGKLAG
jgi:hypothetical protein